VQENRYIHCYECIDQRKRVGAQFLMLSRLLLAALVIIVVLIIILLVTLFFRKKKASGPLPSTSSLAECVARGVRLTGDLNTIKEARDYLEAGRSKAFSWNNMASRDLSAALDCLSPDRDERWCYSYRCSLVLDAVDLVGIWSRIRWRTLEARHAHALYDFGLFSTRQNDRGFPCTTDQAFRYAADHGHAAAQFEHALRLERAGHLAPARRYLELAEANGNRDARTRIATSSPPQDNVVGCDFPDRPFNPFRFENRTEALRIRRRVAELHKQAADAGNAVAQVEYGLCLERDTGIGHDKTPAAVYFKRAADQGYAEGQVQYGLCLQRNQGVPGDSRPDYDLFRLAAEGGNAEGMLLLGLHLLRDPSRPIRERAVSWLQKSADAGNPVAQVKYGWLYKRNGKDREFRDYCARAGGSRVDFSRYFNKESTHESFSAQIRESGTELQIAYGDFLMRETWFLPGLNAAKPFYQSAADNGSAEGMWKYGFCLEVGNLGDRKMALTYFRRSAEQGDALGQLVYGFFLYTGLMASSKRATVKEAARYFAMSAAQGNRCADVWYTICRAELLKSTPAPVEASLGPPLFFATVDTSDSSDRGSSYRLNVQLRPKVVSYTKPVDRPAQFIQEVAIHFALRNSTVLPITGFSVDSANYDLPRDRNSPYSLSTQQSRTTLDKVLSQRRPNSKIPPLTPTAKAIIVVGIVYGMKYIHESGVGHFDLKPANIFLTDANEPLIGDFGSAKFLFDQVSLTPISTSPRYTAPEMVHGRPVGKPADVFAFAMTFWEILTGEEPFAKYSDRDAIRTAIGRGDRPVRSNGQPLRPDETGDPLNLCQRCWASAPEKRPTFAEIFDELREKRYQVLPGVDYEPVNSYVKRI
jgi:TPR repeat protein